MEQVLSSGSLSFFRTQSALLCFDGMAGGACGAATRALSLSSQDHQFLQSEILWREADRYDG